MSRTVRRIIVIAAVALISLVRLMMPSSLTSRDGRTRISLPGGWSKMAHMATGAQLAASNVSKHEYVELVSEDVADVGLSLTDYAATRRDGIVSRIDSGVPSEIEQVSVNGTPAARFEVHGITRENQFKVGYSVTVMTVGNQFVQVIGWTGESQFSANVDELETLASGVKEVK